MFLFLSLQKVRITKLYFSQMKIYQSSFRFDEHYRLKINISLHFFKTRKSSLSCKMVNILPKFWFCVSRNCEIFAQILMACFAKFRKLLGKFCKTRDGKFAKISRNYEDENFCIHPKPGSGCTVLHAVDYAIKTK